MKEEAAVPAPPAADAPAKRVWGGWKVLRALYLVFLAAVLAAGFAYGVPLYRYLKRPLSIAPAAAAPGAQRLAPSAEPGEAGRYATTGGLLNADASMLPRFREIIDKVAPKSAQAYTGLALLYQMKGLFSEAVGLYQKALSIDPHFPDAHFRLGTAYHELGQPNAAIQSYGEAIRLKPDYLYARYGLAAAYQADGRTDDAERAYLEILNRKPGEAQALNNLAILYEDQGSADKALATYEAAARAAPKDPLIQKNLAEAREAYRGVRPVAAVPAELSTPRSTREKAPSPPKPARSWVKTHTVRLKSGQSLSGRIVSRQANGFWFEEDEGVRVFLADAEVDRVDPIQ